MDYDDLIPKTKPGTIAKPTPVVGSSVTPQDYGDLVPKTPPGTIAKPTPAADETGNSFWYDTFHQPPADLSRPQTWRDWATKTYSPTATDYGNAALDDV